MSYEQKDNSGSIFVNERKQNDKQPDRTGTAMIDGKEYYVSGWLKNGKRGPWLSLAFKPKEEARAPRREAAPAATAERWSDTLDDDLPF